MNNPEEAVLFINHCLNFESKIPVNVKDFFKTKIYSYVSQIIEEVEGPSVLRFSGGVK
jgi:hypothetical protein